MQKIKKQEDKNMSKFSLFMKANKVAKENKNLRDSNTVEVQVTGKPNLSRPRLNASQYLSKMIVASTVYPDLYDKELQDSYGVMTPEDLVFAMVDNPGEYNNLGEWIQKFQGFTKTFEEKVDEAKN